MVREIKLVHVHKLLQYFIKEHKNSLYKKDSSDSDASGTTFEEPYFELMVWAILTNKKTLVDFFWSRTSNPLLSAVIAGSIYSKLSWFYQRDNDELLLQKLKQKFQNRANRLTEIGAHSDQGKVMSLLERRNVRWGNKNVMEIAHIGHLRAFIASKSLN